MQLGNLRVAIIAGELSGLLGAGRRSEEEGSSAHLSGPVALLASQKSTHTSVRISFTRTDLKCFRQKVFKRF